MSRVKLNHRRPSVVRAHYWRGSEYHIGVGFDPKTGQPREVFVSKSKGHDIEASMVEACVVISVALQSGASIRDMAASLDFTTRWVDGEEMQERQTVVGLVADAVMEEQIIWEAISGEI